MLNRVFRHSPFLLFVMDEQQNPMHSPFGQVCDEMIQLHAQKNHDYGNAFGDVYQRFISNGQKKMADGYASGMLNVKVSRINALLMTEENWVKDESVEDSLLDLASYAIMYLVERRKK